MNWVWVIRWFQPVRMNLKCAECLISETLFKRQDSADVRWNTSLVKWLSTPWFVYCRLQLVAHVENDGVHLSLNFSHLTALPATAPDRAVGSVTCVVCSFSCATTRQFI